MGWKKGIRFVLLLAVSGLLAGCRLAGSGAGAIQEGEGQKQAGQEDPGGGTAGGEKAGLGEVNEEVSGGGLDPEKMGGSRGSADRENASIFTAAELMHEPYGWDNLYGAKEVPPIWWDRVPGDPQEGEGIIINLAVDEKVSEMDLWIEWTLNGQEMEAAACKHAANLKASGITKKKYQGKLGPFKQGDRIEYTICGGSDGEAEKISEAYQFTTCRWEAVEAITECSIEGDVAFLTARTATLRPQISLAFQGEGTVRLRIDPAESGEQAKAALPISYEEREGFYLFGREKLALEVMKEPFALRVTDAKGKELLVCTKENGLEILTDGREAKGIRYQFAAPPEDGFYGFGMKYDSLNQRNKTVHTYCVNWYKDQAGETYTPVPYYFVPDKYGFYLDSTYYSKFEIDTVQEDVCSVEVRTGPGRGVDSYLFFGDNASIAKGYAAVAGNPVLPPVWAFGPWISANEWDKQSEVMKQLEETIRHEIPTTVIVLEAWSDEETFYTFNDSQYEPQKGDHVPELSDFRFGERWPDPKNMVDQLHENGIKVLLWQIPVLKHSGTATVQSLRDQSYAMEQGYVLQDGKGKPYRLPEGTWFGSSLLMDFTSRAATEWFLSKRRYLLEEMGIDGFKTDGGEFVWGRDVTASDGTKGDELRNLYPDLYAQAYFDYARDYVGDALTFSRAGGSSMQLHPVCWVGDQSSTHEAFEAAIRATLSASMSGIPFVAWDIAGFSGSLPSAELYQRSVAQAAFSPIMQVHSESSGDPVPSQARTPWNMAEQKQEDACLETYRYYANVRMNLLPYLYSSARHSSMTGEPLMRSMAYSFPGMVMDEKYQYQYMLGDSLLVAPVTGSRKVRAEVYLPEGTWYGLFDHQRYNGGEYEVGCEVNEIPVFVREGSILAMNLGKGGELGSSVGNRVDAYESLTLRIYPGQGTVRWYDYVEDALVDITSDGRGNITIKGQEGTLKLELVGNYEEVYVNEKKVKSSYNSNSGYTYVSIIAEEAGRD